MKKKEMKVVIFGAGLVGEAVGRIISDQGHDVCFIDNNRNTVRKIRERMDVQIVQGMAEKTESLREAGVQEADIILAVTNLDHINIILTLLARSMNPNALIVARVKDADFANNPQLWQSHALANTVVISPEKAVIEKARLILDCQHAFDVVEFLDGRLRIAGFRLEKGNALSGTPLNEVRKQFPSKWILVVGVERGDDVFIPNGDTILEDGDRIFITLPQGVDLAPMLALLGKQFIPRRKYLIVGGGSIAESIARELEKDGRQGIIMESDYDRCQALAETLDKTVLLHGDATDASLLGRAITSDTVFLAMTGMQEINFFVAMMARKRGAMQVLAMMDNDAYFTMGPELGVDAILSPRIAAVGSILRFMRVGRILDAAVVLGGRLEIFLAEVEQGSLLDGKPLKDVNIPKGVIIAAAVQNSEVLVPHGSLRFRHGDLAVIMAIQGMAHIVDDLIARPS